MTTKGKFRIKGLNRQQQIVWGAFCILIAILLFAAFTSFFKTWKKCLPEDGDAEMRSLNSSFLNRSSQGVVNHGDIETPFIHFLFCFHF